MTQALILWLLSAGALVLLAPSIFSAILSFLPDSAGLPTGVHTALTFAVDKLNAFNFIFPVQDLVNALIFIAIFEVAILIFKGTMRVIKTIRGTS